MAEFLSKVVNYFLKQTRAISNDENSTANNIAVFLGMITLGANIPIFKQDLDIKGVIIKSIELSKLKMTVPLICNILLGLKNSLVFVYSVPYIASLLDLLKEIQKLP